ncbi:MAG: ketoacyl-ACP synthase III [Chitinophagaceae bacterium]|nr:MAG: ketoacyl-ACP synthase III [Chitinophagaceae bacterium]
MKRTVITGSGSFIPQETKSNQDFLAQPFYGADGRRLPTEPAVLIEKFRAITGISERRYADTGDVTSTLAAAAGARALESSGIDPEELDLLIVAHNFGDVAPGGLQCDTVPALASRVKNTLGIRNPRCIAFDTLFGCPGWLMGVIQADAFFKAGMARKALVIGAETLSRVVEPFDRDSMLFSDGAGAAVLEYRDTDGGILHSSCLSHCTDEVAYLKMDRPFREVPDADQRFMKMNGRKVYEYALTHVPSAMKECLDGSGHGLGDLKKIFIHQANQKMVEAIVQAFYKLYGQEAPADIMPMCVHRLGNSSVATIPTLFDLVTRGQQPGHQLESGDLVLFASVGAGMNINAVCYRC